MPNNLFDPDHRTIRRFLRLADAFASSPTLETGEPEGISYDRRELPMQAINLASEFLSQFQWPSQPTLTYRGMRTATRDENTLPQDADAQILLSAHIVTASGVRTEVELPVFVRKHKLLEPSIAIVDGQPRILAQSLVDEIVNKGTWKKKVDPRGGIFGPPMDREARELFLSMDEDFKESPVFSRGMYSVASKEADMQQYPVEQGQFKCRKCGTTAASEALVNAEFMDGSTVGACPKCYHTDLDKVAATPRVDQVLAEVAHLIEEGYSGVDCMLKIHSQYPTIADAVIEAAKEKGLLEDV